MKSASCNLNITPHIRRAKPPEAEDVRITPPKAQRSKTPQRRGMLITTSVGYQYRSLSATDSVRLLRIARADDQPHGMLLSLAEARLDEEPDFTALSYTWNLPEYTNSQETADDGPGRVFRVVCDGKQMVISENLFDFLRAALDAQKSDGQATGTKSRLTTKVDEALSTLPLWVDAFCINQADAEEKRHQVLLMHRIYSSARRVVVWLGPSRPDPDVVWIHDRFIPSISRLARTKPKFVDRYLRRDPTCGSPDVVEELGQELCHRWTSAWLAFAIFVGRYRWFDRGWIVQEVVLADPRGVSLLCGGVAFSWKRLTAFAQFLRETGWGVALGRYLDTIVQSGPFYPSNKSLRITSSNIGERLLKIGETRQLLAQISPSTGLREWNSGAWDGRLELAWFESANHLVHLLRSSEFGDGRDHIYGCLGMLSILLPRGLDSPIIPDYDRSVEEVFTSTAALFLQKTPLLTELSRIGERGKLKLPSWVPDYSVPYVYVPRPGLNRNFALNQCVGLTPGTLKEIEARIWGSDLRRPTLKGSCLAVHGFRVGTISHVTADEPFRWQSPEVRRSLVKMVSGAKTAPDLLNGNFWDVLSSVILFMCAKLKLANLQPQWLGPSSWTRLLRENAFSPDVAAEKKVREELADRHLYVTDNGTLGLGPLATQPGDEAWLVEGAGLPFVLRRVHDRPGKENEDAASKFEFVGETDLRGYNVTSTTNGILGEERGFFQEILLA